MAPATSEFEWLEGFATHLLMLAPPMSFHEGLTCATLVHPSASLLDPRTAARIWKTAVGSLSGPPRAAAQDEAT